MSRAQQTSTDQQNGGGAVSPYVAGKNGVINGAFDIAQRGTSIGVSSTAYIYTLDRWLGWSQTSGPAMTVSRQATSDTTNLPNIQYCARVQRNASQTATGIVDMVQALETANSIQYAGKTVTLSFYARAGANFSSASNALYVYLQTGTGTDNSPVGFTGAVLIVNSSVTLTSTWQRFSFTAPVGATSTQILMGFYYTPTGTAGTNDYFEITGVQLEIGSVATPFSRAGATLQGELALCQRYYYRVFPNASASTLCPSLYCGSSTLAYGTLQFPTQMRIMPTALEQTGTASDYVVYASIGGTTCSAIPTFYDANYNSAIVKFTVASGLNTGYSGYARTGSTAGYLGWSAEL